MSELAKTNYEQAPNDSPWGEDYLKDVPEFAGERKIVDLEDIANLCSFENAAIYGHGTATAGNGHEIVESIFDGGVRGFTSEGSIASENIESDGVLGSTDITDTARSLWTSDLGELDFSKIREKLNNWPHRNPKNIILMRLPLEYYSLSAYDSHEKTEAYFVVHSNEAGRPTYYIDRRFIIGNYDTETGKVEISPHFEPNISGSFKQELDDKFQKVQDRVEARNREIEESRPFILDRDYSDEPEDTIGEIPTDISESDSVF
jgi:hypothetical protein